MNTSATSGQIIKILELLEQKKVTPDKLQKILESGLLSDVLEADVVSVKRDVFRGTLNLLPKEISITIDYSLSLEQMIALGKYDYVNSDIAPNFKVSGKGKKELMVELVRFNRAISSEKAIEEMNKMGLRPATLAELLAFGAAHPETQRKFPIIALGSSCVTGGDRRVPCLREYGSRRFLSLLYWDGVWVAYYRFLAVRK